MGPYATSLQNDTIMPTVWDEGSWGRRQRWRSPMPNPQERKSPPLPSLRRETSSMVERGPEKLTVLSKASEAYQHRPRTYEAAIADVGQPNLNQGDADDNGYREVSRKRMKRRPASVASAQHYALQVPQQTRINFESAMARFATPTPTTVAEPAATTTSTSLDRSDTTKMRVRILLWNTEGNKQALEVLLEEAKYDLVAVQEPWINRETKSMYCPRSSKYHLVFKLEGWAAIYVIKRFEVGQWDFVMSDNWCRVWFPEANLGQGNRGFELWSIYNPPDSKEVPSTLVGQPKPAHPVIVAGDFNLQHPMWDEFEKYERNTEDLLQLSSQWDLVIRPPKGAITRAPQGQQRGRPSAIDHFWTRQTSRQHTMARNAGASRITTSRCLN
ncbi:Endonuclease/exonuclease/phosphatase [Apodospora peruviana]|uniref:Endonuclease/exonuclease/phosphatase n=1 Tax=Apodospora peruviana TaxID=516989 RepID=A0AAE0IDD1_9PEZI|nr:Endonuclease/exonuclease/phosphatase [Apodospora peruviana]